MEKFELQVIVSSGLNAPEKATLGLATALAAASSGASVVVFFTMHGAIWADPQHGHEHVFAKFETIAAYLELLAEMEVVLEGCTACVEELCPAIALRPGFRLGGLSVAAIRALTVPTLTF